jgi:hypothetical protein
MKGGRNVRHIRPVVMGHIQRNHLLFTWLRGERGTAHNEKPPEAGTLKAACERLYKYDIKSKGERQVKTITYEQFKSFRPCWLGDPAQMRRAQRYSKLRDNWTAFDILDLTDVPAADHLWLVLRPELIDEPILHEFACRCAEKALELIKDPDPRSVEAIRVKRAWLRGEATTEELAAARDAARDAAWAAGAAARAAARAAGAAAWDAARAAARDAAWAAAEQWQISMLREMLEAT